MILNPRHSQKGVWGENCQWQFGNESSDENWIFSREVRGSRNVTKSPLALQLKYRPIVVGILIDMIFIMKYIALLRGVNVGGNTKIKMAELKTALENTEFSNISTYIQSGNILFTSENTDIPQIEKIIHDVILKVFNLDIAVVVKSSLEWQQVINNAPNWWGESTEFKHNLIVLLHPEDTQTTMNAIGALKPDIEFAEAGEGVIYQSISIQYFGRTTSGKLASNPVYKQLTIRNYNTANKLLHLLNTI